MTYENVYPFVWLAWLAGAACFILGLHYMNSPATARNGNRLSAAGMAVAVGATAILLLVQGISAGAWAIIIVGFIIGGAVGLWTARTVPMTAMPQLVSVFNAVGGGAAALVAIADFLAHGEQDGASVSTTIFVVLGVAIGCVTFTGSLVASGKLQGVISGKPIVFPGARILTVAVGLVAVFGTIGLVLHAAGIVRIDPMVANLVLLAIIGSALVFGVTMVLPIGGADMPVVISLLNSFTGTAAAMAGFVLDNPVLIIAGALVGASGGILTKLMADAMNRSILSIVVGGFGGGEGTVGAMA
jgi:NAD(P) transhydrogenase subunit beta